MIPPGTLFDEFLDSIYTGVPLKIIETGCMRDLAIISEYGDGWSTLYIARWVKCHPECQFSTVDMSLNAIELAEQALSAEKLEKYCSFTLGDSLTFLRQQRGVDFAFLDSCDGLEHGLDEFKLAASAGARLIVMDDYDTKAKAAIAYAAESGWAYKQNGRYSVLRRQD